VGDDFAWELDRVIPVILNANAGTRYGIPFPGFVRVHSVFVAANVPGVLRLWCELRLVGFSRGSAGTPLFD